MNFILCLAAIHHDSLDNYKMNFSKISIISQGFSSLVE